MTSLLVAVTLFVAAVAAMRSTWSPCGLSMLSSITPIGERGRSNVYGRTVAFFLVGALAGGATLGVGAALVAGVVRAIDLTITTRIALAAAFALVAVASDFGWAGFRLPAHSRQVNERWLTRYRAWVYGTSFGWQIGVGLATYITTAAVYLFIVLAALGASPIFAFIVCLGFGLARGLAVFLGTRATSIERLQALHRRLDELDRPSATVAAISCLVAALALGYAVVGWFAIVIPLATVGVAVARRRTTSVQAALTT